MEANIATDRPSLFALLQLVNRKKQLKMYRCWMQVRARKLLDGQGPGSAGGARPVMLEDRFKKN